MHLPFVAFAALVASSFLDFVFDWPPLLGVRLLVAGAALVAIVPTLSPNDRRHLGKTLLVALAGLAVPAIWILIQLLPLPWLANPAWENMQTALGGPLLGHISIDLAATRSALGQIVFFATILLLTASVTIDRLHAEWSLYVLTAAAAFLSALSLTTSMGTMRNNSITNIYGTTTADCAAVGIVLALSTALLAFERFETRRGRQTNAGPRLLLSQGACLVAAGIELTFLVLNQYFAIILCLFFGIATFTVVVAIRRLGMRSLYFWVLAVGIVATAGVAIDLIDTKTKSLLVAYSTAPPASIEQADRMILDAPIVGNGAGSIRDLEGLYRGVLDIPLTASPSLAAQLVIDLGLPAFWVVLAIVIALFGLLLRGALARGRDSVYPIAGASILVVMVTSGFVNAGLGSQTMTVFSGGVLGLALGQRISRRTT